MNRETTAVRGVETAADAETAVRDALVAELDMLRARVRGDGTEEPEAALARAREGLGVPGPLDRLADGFGLSDFERAVLVLTAGPELVAAVADELAAAGAGPRLTFGTALALLPGAHWSALTPAAPLRHWRLVRLVDPLAPVRSPLVIDERVLHHLVGAGVLDPALAAVARPAPRAPWLPLPLEEAAEEILTSWGRGRAVLVAGPQARNARAVAAAAADRAGLDLLEVDGADLPGDPEDLAAVLRRMERETVLSAVAWTVDLGALAVPDARRLLRRLEDLRAPLTFTGGGEADAGGTDTVRLPRLSGRDRAAALRRALTARGVPGGDADGRSADGEPVLAAAAVFDLPVDGLARVADDVAAGVPLWESCRRRTRVPEGGLAQVLEPRARWDHLVLPDPQVRQLRALVSRVRHRALVEEEWGFAGRSARGTGTVALFAGPSGTGKTLAAEVVAHDLALDLVRVDLSQVMSKYIGETEKHLAALFDAAEDGGSVMLFDEADTLFGKRSEVRDSHDRYANIEVGYLLQRVESFRGLAILTTNTRTALDPAFTRRIATVVTFPYPDGALRRRLWDGAFPAATPTDGVDTGRLAAVDLPGGGIAAAALSSAYLAADDREPVSARHVETAARWELAKSGRSMPGGPGESRPRRPTAGRSTAATGGRGDEDGR